jgi:hypothetical protein
MVNCMGTFVNGLAKRPGTEFVGNLTGGSFINTGSYIHKIERDANERYIVVFTDSTTEPVRIYDAIDGSQKTVTYEDIAMKYYMQSDNPKQTMRAFTAADTTIVVNRSVTVSMTNDTVDYVIPSALIYEDAYYELSQTEPETVKEKYLWTGEVISVSKMTDLPNKKVLEYLWDITVGGNEIVYRVENFSGSGIKSPTFYLKCERGDTHFTECVGEGEKYRINNTTAPHKITRQSDGTFHVDYITYDERVSGSSEDNPLPSFIGQTIQDLTFFNGRLWFLLSDGVVGSRSLEFFNFFQKTATEVPDDDPIDILDAGSKAGVIESMGVYDKTMILLGRDRQLVLESGSGNMTPKTAVLTQVTTFGVVPHTEPVEVGSSVFFLEPKDRFLATREFMILPDTLIEDAADITAHVPKYIPFTNGQDYAEITGSSLIDTLFVHSTGDPTAVYVYKYYWTGNERVQASWHRWNFNKNIVSIMMFGGTHLYVVFKDSGSVHLERIDTDFDYVVPDGVTKDLDSACLDRRVMVTGSYDVGTDVTSWSLPYHEWVDQDNIVGIDPLTGFAIEEGSLSGDNTTFTADGDYDGQDLIVGLKFKSEQELSRWCLKPQQGTPFLEDSLKLREIALSFKETGYFRVEYQVTQRPVVAQQEYTATVIGESTLGKVELRHGVHRFSMYSRPIDTQIKIINDSWLPMKIQTGEYSGYYGGRYKRV